MSWPACFATASGPTGFGPMLFPGRVRDAGLRLAALSSGRAFLEDGLSLTDPDQAGRARAVERIVELAEHAAALDAPLIVGLVRGKAPADGDLDAAVGRFVESMQECVDRTAAAGGDCLGGSVEQRRLV